MMKSKTDSCGPSLDVVVVVLKTQLQSLFHVHHLLVPNARVSILGSPLIAAELGELIRPTHAYRAPFEEGRQGF